MAGVISYITEDRVIHRVYFRSDDPYIIPRNGDLLMFDNKSAKYEVKSVLHRIDTNTVYEGSSDGACYLNGYNVHVLVEYIGG